MNKKNIGIIALSSLVIILLIIGFSAIIKASKRVEFYARVKESFTGSSIVEPLVNEDIAKDYPVVQLNVGNLQVGALIKVSADKEFIETYPPVARVLKYEVIINDPTKKVEDTKDEISTTTTITKEEQKESAKGNNTSKTTTKKTTTTTRMPKPTTTKFVSESSSEANVINLLQSRISKVESNRSNKSFGETAKEYFTSTIDFIFYGKDINGVYFKDLTSKAKLTVIKLALKLDNLIDTYYPGYKMKISSSYQNAKAKLIELYLDKTAEYCANHDNICLQAKSDFQDMKNSFGITWDFLSGLVKEYGPKAIQKLKDWYEVYKSN